MQEKKRITLTQQETDRLLEQLCQTWEYQNMNPHLTEEWKQRFAGYCMGKKTLPLTYDPFYKKIFHPHIHSERLSGFISSILGRKVRVLAVLAEGDTLDGGALLVMDILVQLDDGSLANVEIQKIPYLFPAERMSCYSADVLLRQYSRVKGARGKAFKYSDIKKVYTIVIFEKSTRVFHKTGNQYCHYGKTVFDTGLPMELLQEFYLINLDIFRKSPYAKEVNTLNGWLTLLTTEDVCQVDDVIRRYPWLEEIYREMEEYLHRPEEVLGMYSEALRILDRNTTKYMIEELQKEVEQTKKEAEARVRQARKEAEDKAKEAEGKAKEAEGKAKEAEGKAKEAENMAIQIMTEAFMESGMDETSARKKAEEKIAEHIHKGCCQ